MVDKIKIIRAKLKLTDVGDNIEVGEHHTFGKTWKI